MGGSEQNAAAIEGLAQIAPIITRYARVEEIYIEKRQKNKSTNLSKDFRTQVVDLYAKILAYQVAIISHCQRHTISELNSDRTRVFSFFLVSNSVPFFFLAQYVRAIPKLDDWNGLLEGISKVDAECRKFTQIFDSEGIYLLVTHYLNRTGD